MSYYEVRRCLRYYTRVKQILDNLGSHQSLLDIGPADTPCVLWGQFSERFQIDPSPIQPLAGVTSVRGHWPHDWNLGPVSVALCLQVMEHVENPTEFAACILRSVRHTAIVSVPFLWPHGTCCYHRWEPIDYDLFFSWFPIPPRQYAIIGETDGTQRLVATFDPYE